MQITTVAIRLLQGRELEIFQEDPNQLGADFVDREQILRLTYYSKDPTYRPAVDELLHDLRKLDTK